MEATYPTKAIVLKREPWSENDTRVVLYTKEHGKLDLIARGTRKIKSKLAGHLEPFCLSNIMVVHGKSYNYIGAAVSENCYSNIKQDLDKLIQVGQALNILNSLIKENLKDESIYDILAAYLKTINQKLLDSSMTELLTSFFILKLLVLMGHKPELYTCVVCKNKITPGANRFDLLKGGVICTQCKNKGINENNQLTISDDCIKILRLAIKENFTKIKMLKVNNLIQKEVNKIIGSFQKYI